MTSWRLLRPSAAICTLTLSTQQNKGPACVDFLIDCLAAQDSLNVAGRAAWGLGYGVAPGHGSEQKIAAAAIEVYRHRRAPNLRNELLKMMQNYSSSAQVAQLEELATLPNLSEKERDHLLKIAATAAGREDSAGEPAS